jgi:phosphatidylserine decarboxylase
MSLTIKLLIIITVFLLISYVLFSEVYFKRKPHRNIPEGEVIVSPANGVVKEIVDFSSPEVTIEKGYLGKIKTLVNDVSDRGKIVLIVMNPLNVHVQRAPFDGEVVSQKHTDGKFLNAVNEESFRNAMIENEHNEILFRSPNGNKFKVIQIAGALARRINDYTNVGQTFKKGDEIGSIDLGSQVALVLPENVLIKVKKGDIVIDGESIIGQNL